MMQRSSGNSERPTWKLTLKRCAPPALTAVALWSGLPGLSAAQSGWKWFGKQGPQAQAPATPRNGFASSVQRLMEQARQEAAAGQMSQAVATAQRAHKIADAASAVLGNDPQCSPAVTQKFLADMQVLAQTQGAKSSAAHLAAAPAVTAPARPQIAAAHPVAPSQPAPAVVPKATEREQWLAVIRSGETATPRAAATPPAIAAVPVRQQPAAAPSAITHTAPVVPVTALLPAVTEIALRPQFAVDGGGQPAVTAPAPLPTPMAVTATAPVVSTSIMPSFGIAIEGGEAAASPQMAATASELPAWGSDLFSPSKPAITGLPVPVLIRWSSSTQALDTQLGFSTEIVSYDEGIRESVSLPAAPVVTASPALVEQAARPTPVSVESARVAIPAVGDISFAPSIALLDEPTTAPESEVSVPVSTVSEPESREEVSAPSQPVRVRQYPVANALAIRETAIETAVETTPGQPVPAASTMPSVEIVQPPQALRLPDPVLTEWSSAVPATARQPRAAKTTEDSVWQPSKVSTESEPKASTPPAAESSKQATVMPQRAAMTPADPTPAATDVVAIKHETPLPGTFQSAVALPTTIVSRFEAPTAVAEPLSLEASAMVDVITLPQGPSVWSRQASLKPSNPDQGAAAPSAASYVDRLARRWKLSPTMLVSLAGGAALFLLGCSTYVFARRQNLS